MPDPRLLNIKLSQQQQTLLEQVVRRHSSPQGLVQRAGVILSAAKGMNNTQIAQELQLARNTVRTWRQRWLAAAERLKSVEAEGISDKELLQMMAAVLADAPRPGTPATFTTEQVVQIIARHGTVSLIANLEIATGTAIAPTIGPTRTEYDNACPYC